MPTDFFDAPLCIEELEALLTRFGTEDSFALLGHSWGGILGSEYAATRQAAGLRKLVLADTPASA